MESHDRGIFFGRHTDMMAEEAVELSHAQTCLSGKCRYRIVRVGCQGIDRRTYTVELPEIHTVERRQQPTLYQSYASAAIGLTEYRVGEVVEGRIAKSGAINLHIVEQLRGCTYKSPDCMRPEHDGDCINITVGSNVGREIDLPAHSQPGMRDIQLGNPEPRAPMEEYLCAAEGKGEGVKTPASARHPVMADIRSQ